MDKTEARASLRVLVEVARADGKLAIDEKRILDLIARHEYEDDDPPPSRFDDSRDFEMALRTIVSPEVRQLTWKACLTIASLDGRCSEAEHRVLTRVHAALVPDEPLGEVIAAEDAYSDRLGEVQEEIEKATIDFLHHMSDASGGGKLSQSAYEVMVRDLTVKKKQLFARVLSIPPPRR